MTLPIYDRYNRETGWKKLLAVPGRVFQVPEVNEMQSIIMDNQRQIANILFKDGAIMRGMQLTVVANEAIIEAGQIYAYGLVFDIPATTLDITRSAEERIGVKLTKTTLTEVEDATLTDPVSGAENQGLPGAYRETYDVEFTINDDTAFTLYVLRFGDIVINNVPPQFDSLNQTLAMRTYEESGSYLVDGMETRLEDTKLPYVLLFRSTQLDELAATVGLTRLPAEADETLAARIVDDTVTAVVEAGIAYVSGYRINKPSSTRVLLPKARDERFVNNEQHRYQGTFATTDQKVLFNGPVSRLGEVTMHVRKTLLPLRSPFISTDFLPVAGPIVEIVSVTYTDPGSIVHTYTDGVHFNFTGTELVWLDPDNPDPDETVPRGATYTVVLDYNATLEVGEVGDEKDVFMANTTTLELTGTISGQPVTYTPDGFLTVDYYWYLNRADLLYVDKNGEINRLLGESNRVAIAPTVPTNTLGLAEIRLVADSGSAAGTVRNLELKRYTMTDIRALAERLDELQHNQAIQNLNTSAQLGAGAVTLKGIFTDNFTSLDKIDSNNAEFQAQPVAFDIVNGHISTAETRQEVILEADANRSTNIRLGERFATLAYTGSVVRLAQTKATSTIKVNPYSAFQADPLISLIPERDVSPSVSGNVNVSTSLSGLISVAANVLATPSINVPNLAAIGNSQTAQRLTFQGTARYANPRTVLLYGEGFAPFTDNLALTIDGVAVNVTPGPNEGTSPDPTVAGSLTVNGKTTVRANSAGIVRAQFTIPANTILSGRREVVLTNTTERSASVYTAENPINFQVTVQPSVVVRTRNRRDPVAQTFVLTRADGGDALVRGVKLYFSAKPTVPTETVTVQIRPTIAGLPVGDEYLASKTLTPAEVSVSADGSVATTVMFDDPAYCVENQEYAIVVLTGSATYEVYKGVIGEFTIGATPQLVSQQLAEGVLLTSANGSTWTPEQSADLTFELLTADLEEEGTLYFEPVTFATPVSQLQVFPFHTLPAGTDVVWEYSTDDFATVTQLGVLDPRGGVVDLGGEFTSVTIRARLKQLGSSVSAVIDHKAIKLMGINAATSGKYVSRTIALEEPPTSVRAQLDLQLPSGASATVYYGLVDGFGAVSYTQMNLLPGFGASGMPGFFTYTFESDPIVTALTQVKIKVVLTGANGSVAPKARRLISTLE